MSEKVILLVEDNADEAELAMMAFKKAQVFNRIDLARDGAEALEYLFSSTGGENRTKAAFNVAFVLLDLKMPRLDGLEVLRKVRAHPITRNLPVIVFTSSAEESDLTQSYSLGANSYIRKPIDLAGTSDVIKTMSRYWLEVNVPPPVSH